MSFLLRRLGFYLLAAWASLTLAFLLPRLLPGDPATVLFARFQGKLRPEALAALRGVFGLDDVGLFEQYSRYLGHMVRGDLGISISHFPAQVTEVMGGAFGWSLLLGGVSVLISFVLGFLLSAARLCTWMPATIRPWASKGPNLMAATPPNTNARSSDSICSDVHVIVTQPPPP
jgi:peptide/nickel transport system permease protein